MRSALLTRFLTAVAAGSTLAGAGLGGCGGSIEPAPGASSGGGSSTSSSSGASSGSSASSTSTSTSSGTLPPEPPSPPPPSPPPPDAAVYCKYGKPTQQCFTHGELEVEWNDPYHGGLGPPYDGGYDAGPAPWDPDGCLPAGDVQDGCCNPAVAGPTVNGSGQCCYVFCTGACCGRPFVVGGEARLADVVERSDWLAPEAGPAHRYAVEALDVATRDRLGCAWMNDAAMEHASIAAFARFMLDLLAVGAPASMLLDAQEAARDEIEHARACFAMASRYAGRALGPDALDVADAGAAARRSLAEIAAAAVVEGCIGETLSASLAEERARLASHAYTRAVSKRIAEDEARHAELAWRFVAWAIATGGETVRGAVARALDGAFRDPPDAFDRALAGLDAALVRAHGLLDEAAARATVARVLREIVAPCAASLVAPRRAA